MASWQELVGNGTTVVADGAMGTMLMANGLEFGDPPELWNLEHPEIIRRVQRGYLTAGAQVLLTNTFGGNRLRLELHGRQDRVDQLNRTAAVLARVEVDAADHPAIVAGDIGPSGQISTISYFWAGTSLIIIAGYLATVAGVWLFGLAAARQ